MLNHGWFNMPSGAQEKKQADTLRGWNTEWLKFTAKHVLYILVLTWFLLGSSNTRFQRQIWVSWSAVHPWCTYAQIQAQRTQSTWNWCCVEVQHESLTWGRLIFSMSASSHYASSVFREFQRLWKDICWMKLDSTQHQACCLHNTSISKRCLRWNHLMLLIDWNYPTINLVDVAVRCPSAESVMQCRICQLFSSQLC